jgi:hypothetical protein
MIATRVAMRKEVRQMPEHATGANARSGQRGRAARQRWECHCATPPILLAMYEPGGNVEIKLRDRYYLASGRVHATCPRCGAQHVLDLRPSPEPDTGATGPAAGPSTPPTGGAHGG